MTIFSFGTFGNSIIFYHKYKLSCKQVTSFADRHSYVNSW